MQRTKRRLELETTRLGFVACRLKFGMTQQRCDEATARLGSEEAARRRAQGLCYSTMSFLRLWTNATTSRCSPSGTWNFASVAAA
jgi:hypothetical protein